MEEIKFNNSSEIKWINNSLLITQWQNNSTNIVIWDGLGLNYNLRLADFVRITTDDAVYRFSTYPKNLTIPEIDSQPFDGLGVLVNIGDVARDIKSTANETSVTLVGLDVALLGWALGQKIKGSKIEMWHGFFNANNELITDGGVGGLYKFFTGYINSFAITEQWMQDMRAYVGVIAVNASSIQIILQNLQSGRYTNDNAWQFYSPGDTSMARVGYIETINYSFGAEGIPLITPSRALGTTTVPTEL